jgi:two-component system, cell cycle sensor histidine kinase and response regulator CckA
VGSGRDSSDQTGAERTLAADLAASEARLTRALKAARMYSWELDLDGHLLSTSAGAAEICGFPPDRPFDPAMIARHMRPDDLVVMRARLAELREGRGDGHFRHEWRLEVPGGPVRWFRSTGEVLMANGGPRLYGVTQDVTDHKRLEEALLRARKLEGIGRLAAGVAHDFNNLITAILTSVSFLESGNQESAAEDLDIIRTAASRAGHLVQQLQRFAGKQHIELGDLDVNDVVLDLETVLHRLCGEHCRLELELEPELWPVRGDPGALGQVLIQLVANAAEALEGGGKVTITTANLALPADDDATAGDFVELAVCDDGLGLDDATRQHLFEPFFSTKEGGLGLGLASSYGIVEQHGGHIGVSGESARGTRIALRLPRAPDQVAHEPAPTTGTRETILLVEDEELLRRTVVRGLAQLGYDLLVAADGEEALEVAAEHHGPIDVLVTDLVMPGIGGAGLAAELLRTRPETKVIYVSGHTAEMVERRVGGEPGSFLAKPYTVETLVAKIRAAAGR